MDRKAILDKIAAMLKLQEESSFEGESSAAAALIDKLCAKYGVTIEDATTPQALTEEFESQKRLNDSKLLLFDAVARFYDAKAFLQSDYSLGRKINFFMCVGTEAQQIQTRLYYDFLNEHMEKECEKAYKAEKILAELMGKEFTRAGFRKNFTKAFVLNVCKRLREMKIERGDHEHKEHTLAVVKTMEFDKKKHKFSGASGWAATAGASAGDTVNLNQQVNGRQTLQLTGA